MLQEEMLIQFQNILSHTLTSYGGLEDIKMGIETNFGVKIAEQNKIIIFSLDKNNCSNTYFHKILPCY